MEESTPGSGSYRFTFPVANVTEESHTLTLSCAEAGVPSALVSQDFVVREDTAAPEVIRTEPAQYEAGVPSDGVITITFSEALLEGENYEGIQLLKEGKGGALPAEIEKAISSDSLILTPVNPLELNSVYKVVIPSKAVKDNKGNEFKYAYQLQFITYAEPDLTGPVVESTVPENGGLNFPSKAAVKVDFSESVAPGVNAADIRWTANGAPVAFDVTCYVNQLILTPRDPVPYSAACQVIIPAGAVNDLWENPFESEYAFAFTIEEAEDTQPPTVLWSMPEHEMTGVLTDALITIKFDETVLAAHQLAGTFTFRTLMVIGQLDRALRSIRPKFNEMRCTLIPGQNFQNGSRSWVTVADWSSGGLEWKRSG